MEMIGGRPLGPLNLLSVVGTRPEAIKIAPLALDALRRRGVRHRILATGQQDALFDDALAGFGLSPDLRLPPVLRDPSPDVMTERLDAAIRPVLAVERPDMVLVQGDTTSPMRRRSRRTRWASRSRTSRRVFDRMTSPNPGPKSATA